MFHLVTIIKFVCQPYKGNSDAFILPSGKHICQYTLIISESLSHLSFDPVTFYCPFKMSFRNTDQYLGYGIILSFCHHINHSQGECRHCMTATPIEELFYKRPSAYTLI